MKIKMSKYSKLKFEISYEISFINLLLHSNDAYVNHDLIIITNRENAIIYIPPGSRTKI
jgi:hypothetical protein